MKNDLVSYNHAQMRIWVHISFKVKFTHEVFDIREFREACQKQMDEIFSTYGIECDRIGFDSNHFHAIVDLARWDITTLVKIMKGTSGKKLLAQFPEIKKKYFWGSGLWSGTKYVYSVGRDKLAIERYVAKQKYFGVPVGQKSLFEFC
ncbi:MAG: IS200/IS605 family transposase [Nanoarchaeota archaeon]|nr:IS200/IS605 family transposase [Nanoarchaeota archaeon]